jgi:hypothetical protein
LAGWAPAFAEDFANFYNDYSQMSDQYSRMCHYLVTAVLKKTYNQLYWQWSLRRENVIVQHWCPQITPDRHVAVLPKTLLYCINFIQ